MLEGMERAPTALHRVAAWCAAALGVALVAVGARQGLRALAPEAEVELGEVARTQTELDDVAGEPSGERLTRVASTDEPAGARITRGRTHRVAADPRAAAAALERHPAIVLEGRVRSATGRFTQLVELELLGPDGRAGSTTVHFDRTADDGRSLVAPFKLVRAAGGAFVLRPRLTGVFDYEVQPAELRLDRSTSGIEFLVRDDVEHVDLDVIVRGAGEVELPKATLQWQVYRGQVQPPRYKELRGTFCSGGIGPELRGVPVTTVLRWRVSVAGHLPMLATTSLTQGQRALEIRLQPGWGVYVQDWNRGTDSVGEIVLDDRVLGTTDPSGLSLVVAEAPPRVLQVWFGDRCVLQHAANGWRDAVLDYHSERAVLRPIARSRRD